MARTVVVVSDLSGEPGAHTYRVSDGTRVLELDLTDDEFAEYRSAVERYVRVARPPMGVDESVRGSAPAPGTAVPGASRRSTDEVAAIKAWGEANGWEVPKRGRLGAALVEAYEQATFRGTPG